MSIELFPHQIDAIESMRKIEKDNNGLGCVLSHAMGLGKSLTCASFVLRRSKEEPQETPNLIICPLSVLTQWKKEILRVDSSRKVLVYHGKGREKTLEKDKYDFVIATYHTMVTRELHDRYWNYVVLDEAK
jgi:SNF2 family DNA or RNA helicase